MLRKIEGKRRRVWQRMRWLGSITNSMDMNLINVQEIVEDRRDWQCVHLLILVHKPSQFGEGFICALGF